MCNEKMENLMKTAQQNVGFENNNNKLMPYTNSSSFFHKILNGCSWFAVSKNTAVGK